MLLLTVYDASETTVNGTTAVYANKPSIRMTLGRIEGNQRCSPCISNRVQLTKKRMESLLIANEILFFALGRHISKILDVVIVVLSSGAHYGLDSIAESQCILVLKFDISVALHTCTGRNQMSNDDVLLKSAQFISTTSNRCVCQDLGRLLEGSGTDERVDRQGCIGYTKQARSCDCRLSALGHDPCVLLMELELVNLLTKDEPRISNLEDLDLLEHLSYDYSKMLVVYIYALESVDLLDFVEKELLKCILSGDGQDVVRIYVSIAEALGCFYMVPFPYKDVLTKKDKVLVFLAKLVSDDDDPLTLDDRTKLDYAACLSKDCDVPWLSCLEELSNPWKTTGDVLTLAMRSLATTCPLVTISPSPT